MPQALSPDLARQLHLAPALTDRHSRGERRELPPELVEPVVSPDEPEEDIDVWIHSHFHAKGGQKKKALQALSKHKAATGSVHQISEVQQICSSTSRINVKLEYYRDHLEQHETLLRKVEEGFMCQESGTGEPLVNVAKLRSKRRPKRARSPLRARTPSPTPLERQGRLAVYHEKLYAAVAKAKAFSLERRTEQAWRQQLQQSRQERARRERPWLSLGAAVMALVTLQRIVSLWREAKENALQPWSRREEPFLKSFHLKSLDASILVMRKDERKRERSEAIWKEWKKLLRSLQVWIKLRLPLRKARSMNIVKSFMEASSRSYMIRRAVKHFVQSVLLVQRALRHQAQIFRTVQRRIMQPFVWATETQLLCDAFRMRKADAAARIEAHFEDVRLKHWEQEVRLMWLDRAHVWREGYGRFRINHSKRSDGEGLSVIEDDPVRHVVSAPARMRGRASELQKTLDVMQQEKPTDRKTFSLRKSLHGRNFLVMDTLRMNQADIEEITRQMLLDSVDAWWAQYRSYRTAESQSRDNWVNWRRDRLRNPDALVWDPPEVLKCPEMSFSSHGIQWLQKTVESHLRERPEFRSLIGEGF